MHACMCACMYVCVYVCVCMCVCVSACVYVCMLDKQQQRFTYSLKTIPRRRTPHEIIKNVILDFLVIEAHFWCTINDCERC